eukprot:SAG22_NODE_931_length_6450_cov_2.817981_2_plen_74_part_00
MFQIHHAGPCARELEFDSSSDVTSLEDDEAVFDKAFALNFNIESELDEAKELFKSTAVGPAGSTGTRPASSRR